MKTILLYGYLGQQFGRVHQYEVRTPAEAIRAMCVTINGFRAAVKPRGAYRIILGGKDGLSKDRLSHPASDKESIRIVPVISGASGGVGQIILGAVIIAAAFFTGGASLAASGFLTGGITTTFWGGIAVGIGSSLIMGGISQILFKPPTSTSTERPDNKPSFTFDGAINTAAQGNPVPVFYGGPMIIGSQVISAGLAVEQI